MESVISPIILLLTRGHAPLLLPENPMASPQEGETMEVLLNGALKICQQEKGYRFSLDALLLASFFREKHGENILEIGPGSGIISLIIAVRSPTVQIKGLEIQADLAGLARRNTALNNLGERVSMERGDIREAASKPLFDAAVFNPPYRPINAGKTNTLLQKAVARHEIKGSLRDFLHGAYRLLKPGGRAAFIYPAARGAEAISAMRCAKIEPKRMRVVYSYPSAPGQFLLMEGLKDGGEELHLLPPLFIYEEGKTYSREMTQIFAELGTSPAQD
jgi:tRNA1Val (adenine37-N6)-methyltransferase